MEPGFIQRGKRFRSEVAKGLKREKMLSRGDAMLTIDNSEHPPQTGAHNAPPSAGDVHYVDSFSPPTWIETELFSLHVESKSGSIFPIKWNYSKQLWSPPHARSQHTYPTVVEPVSLPPRVVGQRVASKLAVSDVVSGAPVVCAVV